MSSHPAHSSDQGRRFRPKSREDELELLRTDDLAFSRTTAYLEPLIRSALGLFTFSRRDHRILYEELLGSVPLAARRFLRNL